MSRAPARSARIPLDAYYTPDACAEACVAKLDIAYSDVCWEPHAGGGAFVTALARRARRVITSDVNPLAPALARGDWSYVGDFLSLSVHADWIVGNPPYSGAEEHIRHALSQASRVAFLCRLGLLGSAKRASLWREYPPTIVYVLQRRPSFTGGATDNAAYGFFVWDYRTISPVHGMPPELDWISWRNCK